MLIKIAYFPKIYHHIKFLDPAVNNISIISLHMHTVTITRSLKVNAQ